MVRQRYLVVVAGVVFTSFSAIFVRLSDSPPLIIASYRMWMATFLVALLFVRDRITGRDAEQSTKPVQRRIKLLAVASGAFLSLHFGAWITSLEYTSVASSTVLVSMHPIMVTTAGFLFLRERVSWRGVIFMAAALGGGLLLVVGGFETGGSAWFPRSHAG